MRKCLLLIFAIYLNFGLSSLDSEEFTTQISGFSAEVNGQGPFAKKKSMGDASKVPEGEGEKPKVQVIFATASYGSEYQFSGVHYIASYLDCNHAALCDLPGLQEAMMSSVEASGATVLDQSKYVFPPDGLTMVVLLSESHASIHTYPEYNGCYVDLFTCGESCDYKKFESVLRAYLCPQSIDHHVLKR